MHMETMKAFGYIRCSAVWAMDGDGPTRQRVAIQKFADDAGIEIVGWFEESHTGSDLEGRVEFRKMRTALMSNGVRMVIVEKLDRLARSIMVQETVLADFKKHEIELRSATPGEDDLCGNDPTRTLIRQILGCFFEYERKMIESKLRSARERIRKSGKRCEGRKAFGYRPGEAAILESIHLMASKGADAQQIAHTLNSMGILSRYKKAWNSGTIWRIINRPAECALVTP